LSVNSSYESIWKPILFFLEFEVEELDILWGVHRSLVALYHESN